MFVRKKPNKSGLVSVQVVDKSSGSYKVIKTIGASSSLEQIALLVKKGKDFIDSFGGQQHLEFGAINEKQLVDLFFNGIKEIRLVGPELILGKIFDEIGFDRIPEELFRHLVISRLAFPVSKLRTVDYLYKKQGIILSVDRIYRYLDHLHDSQKDLVQKISFEHTLTVLDNQIGVVFYDVTTLYFETDTQDELRKTGFSKEGKHQHPQILLGLLVSRDGYPLAYEIFEGNKYEGHTMLPVVNRFRQQYNLGQLVVVADAGLLTNANIEELLAENYDFILGARIKNESEKLRTEILASPYKNGETREYQKGEGIRLIVGYSESRALKDQANRERGIGKLQKASTSGKLSKKNINNRGYNKYLKIEGDAQISIDYQKLEADKIWDGLKGYLTNTKLSKADTISQYNNLWRIERAFRISKTDLRIRPIYHRRKQRIEAHLCIAFCAYKVFKEFERQLKIKLPGLSAEKAIETANTIFKITIEMPYSKKKASKLHLQLKEQEQLLKAFNLC